MCGPTALLLLLTPLTSSAGGLTEQRRLLDTVGVSGSCAGVQDLSSTSHVGTEHGNVDVVNMGDGTSALRFASAGDYLAVTDHTDWDLGSEIPSAARRERVDSPPPAGTRPQLSPSAPAMPTTRA